MEISLVLGFGKLYRTSRPYPSEATVAEYKRHLDPIAQLSGEDNSGLCACDDPVSAEDNSKRGRPGDPLLPHVSAVQARSLAPPSHRVTADILQGDLL